MERWIYKGWPSMIGTSSDSRLVLLVLLVDASHGSIRKPGHSSSQIRLIGSGRRHDISLGLTQAQPPKVI